MTNSGSGTITEAVGVYVDTITNTRTGGITTAYGIKVLDQTGGTNNDAIKTGAGVVAFGDKVGIGTTSPVSRLDLADGALTLQEMTAPSSPAANRCVLVEDNGSGKTRLMVKFATGAPSSLPSSREPSRGLSCPAA